MQTSSDDAAENSQPATPDAPHPATLPDVPDEVDALLSDEPLSQAFASEQIRLLVQSPDRLFLHWNHARDPHSTLRKALGEAASAYRLAVRLVEVESDEQIWQEAAENGACWFDVKAGRSYHADVGFVADGHPFIRVMSSAVVHTPRKGVSQISDDSHEFQVTAPDFASVLNEAGYAADAQELAREASNDRSTPPHLLSENPATLRPVRSPSSFAMPRSAGLKPI